MKNSFSTPFLYTVMGRCKKHPTYKVMRKPTADCETCKDLWDARCRTETKP